MRADEEPLLAESATARLRLRERRDAIAGQAEDGPLIHRFSAELSIKLNGGVIPVEHGPLHSAAAAVSGNFSELDKQSAAVTLSAMLGMDEQVLQIKSGTAEPGREVVKENGETDRGRSFEAKQHFRRRFVAEQNFPQLRIGGSDIARRFLVSGEITNQLQDQGHVRDSG